MNGKLMLGLLAAAATFCAGEADAAWPDPSGEWTATTVETNTTISLVGDVTLKGQITVNPGVKLAIRIDDSVSGNAKIKLGANLGSPAEGSYKGMFLVHGELEMSGRDDGHRIEIDGSANFKVSLTTNVVYGGVFMTTTNALKRGSNYKRISNAAISAETTGAKVTLSYVDFHDIYNSSLSKNHSCACVAHGSDGGGEEVETVIRHCRFYHCLALCGTAISLRAKSRGTMELSDSEIWQCVANNPNDDSTACGIVRSWGNTVASLYMSSTVIRCCFGQTRGAGLYWNGATDTNTACVVSGCDISHNWERGADSSQGGGGVIAAGSIRFEGKPTHVHHNYSAARGAGVLLYSYDGQSYPDHPVTVTTELGDSLYVHDNHALKDGAGVAYLYTSETTLKKGSTINIVLSGAHIYNNVSSNGCGGGIWIKGAAAGEKCSLNTSIISGDVYGNVAAGKESDGGGVYISDSACDFIGGNVVGNTAGRYGGGICLVADGTSGTFGGVITASHNKAMRGGGLALLKNAEIKMDMGHFDYNEARLGGGAFLTAGSALAINGGTFTGNVANTNATAKGATTIYRPDSLPAGFGGGIFLDKGTGSSNRTTLTFDTNDTEKVVAVYNNLADCGGDDIATYGYYTLLNGLPSAVLFDEYGSIYRWFEDYNPKDKNYPSEFKPGTPERYRTAFKTQAQRLLDTDFATGSGKYVCATLGAVLLMPVELWITDHIDAGVTEGKRWIHLAFEPVFKRSDVNVREWFDTVKAEGRIKYATALTESEFSTAELKTDFLYRDGHGTNDIDKGWIWLTVPFTPSEVPEKSPRLWKVVIDRTKPSDLQ